MMCSVFTAVCCLFLCVFVSEIDVHQSDESDVVRVNRLSVSTGVNTRHATHVQTDDRTQGHEMFPDQLSYHLSIGGRNHTIHLEKNTQLIAQNYTEIYYQDDGSIVSSNPNVKDNCYYHGHIEDLEDSSVSVGVCSGIRGLIGMKQQVYVIEPLMDHSDGDHVLYKQEHHRQKRSSSAESHLSFYQHEPPAVASLMSSRRKITRFKTPRFVELFLVVDNTEFTHYRSNMDIIRQRMLEVVNHVDKIYRPLNIRVLLVGLEVWSSQDQIGISVSSDDTHSRFLEWRKSSLLTRVRHDNAQLVTGVDFLGDTVGLADKFAMCTENSAGVNQDHNENPLGLASTIAHEMGHNLGLSHDTDDCTCDSHNSVCIMTDRVGKLFPDQFSDCSLEQMSVFLETVNPGCLLDIPTSDRLYSGPLCGNAFLDAGEECDCGSVEECKNPCCDAVTCRLTEDSQCAQGDCCENCQIRAAGSLCREAVNECDLDEYCTGLSDQCPPDDFHMNGIPCDSHGGYCHNGRCPTHLQHCQSLWGTGAAVASDLCFYRNTFGRNDSHCGKTKDAYRACTEENMFCGKIFCVGGSEYPLTGQKAVIKTIRGICNIAGDGSEDNLSMVPTGTKCGHNKVCYDYMCQDLNVYGSNENCSLKCNGRGVCNQKKECHCDAGWAPPYCHLQYSQLTSRRVKTVGISVAAALVFLALVLGGFYYKRRKAVSHKAKDFSSGQMNLLHEHSSVRMNPPHIRSPVLIESSMTRPCSPITTRSVPTRPAPPPPQTSVTQTQQTTVTQGIKPSPPPVPPMKPSVVKASFNTHPVTGSTVKVELRPPVIPRR